MLKLEKNIKIVLLIQKLTNFASRKVLHLCFVGSAIVFGRVGLELENS